MIETIQNKLKEIEEQKDVKILFACESGSRAWGFHSPDSDYDVRFVYVHPPGWYLSIDDRKDFIELPVDEVYDINGFDVRKMLRLFRSSNSKIYEWIQSPVLYRKNESFLQDVQSLVPEYFAPKAGIHHYIGLCKNTYHNDLQGESIRLKKYFYALRPVLAAWWIVQHNACPPMEFKHLRQLVTDQTINDRIDALLEKKAGVDEQYIIPPDPVLHHFISARIEHCEKFAQQLSKKETDVTPLNALFRKTIGL